jgi:hypothetical protein
MFAARPDFPPNPKLDNFTYAKCVEGIATVRDLDQWVGGNRSGLSAQQIVDKVASGYVASADLASIRDYADAAQRKCNELTFMDDLEVRKAYCSLGDARRLESQECGNRFVKGMTFGAILFITYKVYFFESAGLAEFQRRFGPNAPFGYGFNGETDGDMAEFLRNRGSISLYVIQIGGDSTATTSLLNTLVDGESGIGHYRKAGLAIEKAFRDSIKGDATADMQNLPNCAVLSLDMWNY